jgi:hypothetical protein
MMSPGGKRRFIGTVRTGSSSLNVPVEAADEASATRALQAQYGTENIIEVRREGDAEKSECMSQAEADVGRAVTLKMLAAWASFVKSVLRRSFWK